MINKNKTFLYFLFVLFILFINIENVSAAKVYAEFELKSDSTKASTKLQSFIDDYCSAIGGCNRYCVEEKSYYADVNGMSSCNNGFKKFYGLTNSSGSKLKDAQKNLIIFLNNQSTLKSRAVTFCKSGELKGSACDAISDNIGNSETGNDNLKSCSYTLEAYGSDGSKKNWTTSYLSYDIKANALSLGINADGSNNIQHYDNGAIVNGSNRYYFYSISGGKYASWDSFSKEYIKRFKNSKNYSCTAINIKFCAVKRDNYYYDWYAELDGKCDKNLYSDLVGTQTSTDGVNEDGVSYDVEDVDINFDIIKNGDISSCEELIETELQELLKTGVNIVKISIPIILIVLGSLDFGQAVFAQNEDGIKKAQAKFIKRIIFAVAIFLIPSALKLILTIAHSIWSVIPADLCGII